MNHSFNVEIATELGIPCAVILDHIWFWVSKNEANGKHFHNGMYWTYNSVKAFSTLFPYLSIKQIRTALDRLRTEGLVEVGNFNDNVYDRTLWYALTEKGKAACLSGQLHLPDQENTFAPQGKPIPDIYNNNVSDTGMKPDIEPDLKTSSCAERCEAHPSTQDEKPEPTPSEFNIILQDGTFYNVPQESITYYKVLYPGVDVDQALRNMMGWSNDAGPNRKTRRGIKRFITSWLIREQDKAGRKGGVNGAVNRGSPGESPRRLAGETIV